MVSKKISEIKGLANVRIVFLLIHYFFGYLFLYPLFATKMTLLQNPEAKTLSVESQWFVYIFTMIIAITLAWPILKVAIPNLLLQKKKALKIILSYTVVLLILNIVLSLIVGLLTNTTSSNNQMEIEATRKLFPMIMIFTTCIFAPIVEECVFRGGVFAGLRKKGFWFAAIISSGLFGAIHILTSIISGDISDLAYVVVYMTIGFVLSLSYEKTNSLSVPIIIHSICNSIAMASMF